MPDEYQNLPPDARNVYLVLVGDVGALKRKVALYLSLFDQPERQFLFGLADGAFHMIQEGVGRDIILTICQLGDWAFKDRKETVPNLSFAQLARRLAPDPGLTILVDQFRIDIDAFLKHRNKLHAHGDLETRIGSASLPTLHKSELEPTVMAALAIINHVAVSHKMPRYELGYPDDAGMLAGFMSAGMKHRRTEHGL